MPDPNLPTVSSVPARVVSAVVGFTPSCLDEEAWRYASEPVRTAVLLTCPRDVGSARGRLSALCVFLADSSWDRVSKPDLDALLTAQRIRAFVASRQFRQMNKGTTKVYQARLQLIRRNVAALGLRPAAPDGINNAARVVFVRHAVQFAPATALLSAVGGMDIPTSWLTRSRLTPLLVSTDSPTDPGAATVVPLPDESIRALWLIESSALEVSVSEDEPKLPVFPSSPSTRDGRRMSNQAALRYAQEQKALMLKLARTKLVAPPELPQDIARVIERFWPSSIRPPLRPTIMPVVRLAARYYNPPTPDAARNPLSIIARYTAFLFDHPRPGRAPGQVEIGDLVLEPNIDWFTASAYPSKRSCGTAASVLRRVARNAFGLPKVTLDDRDDGVAPYTPTQESEVRRVLLFQPSDALNRASCFIGACCLGAGLNSMDLRPLRARDIRERTLDDGTVVILITVTRKGREREAVVRRVYEPMMRRALMLHARTGRTESDLVLGVDEERAAITSPAIARLTRYGAAAEIDLNVNRMRNTWMVAAMQAPIPLIDLLHAAGVESARMFATLARFCPLPDAVQVDRLTHLLYEAGAAAQPN